MTQRAIAALYLLINALMPILEKIGVIDFKILLWLLGSVGYISPKTIRNKVNIIINIVNIINGAKKTEVVSKKFTIEFDPSSSFSFFILLLLSYLTKVVVKYDICKLYCQVNMQIILSGLVKLCDRII
jgi:hypothetical protein